MKLPQLSLRDLFWLVALVAMGCGWWVNVLLIDAACRERVVEQVKKAQFAIDANLRAQNEAESLRIEARSLKEQVLWLQTPEKDRPVE